MGVAQTIRRTGRLPPGGLAARVADEERLLGTLLRYPARYDEVRGHVEAEHFSTAIGQRLFDAITKRVLKGAPCSPEMISGELGSYEWDVAGGVQPYLSKLLSAAAAPDLASLARAVRSAAELQRSDATHVQDVVAWSHRQSELLKILSQRTNLPGIDWENVVEEILSVGRSEVRAVARRIELVFVHLLKGASSPDAPSARRWRLEVDLHLREFQADFTPSMEQLLNLERMWSKARDEASIELAEYGERISRRLPESCPYSLAELRAADSADGLMARLNKR